MAQNTRVGKSGFRRFVPAYAAFFSCFTRTFAQRALCAAAILARDFADILRRFRVGFAVPR
jgi:hypothetical protein